MYKIANRKKKELITAGPSELPNSAETKSGFHVCHVRTALTQHWGILTYVHAEYRVGCKISKFHEK